MVCLFIKQSFSRVKELGCIGYSLIRPLMIMVQSNSLYLQPINANDRKLGNTVFTAAPKSIIRSYFFTSRCLMWFIISHDGIPLPLLAPFIYL